MQAMTLTKTRLVAGRYEGLLSSEGDPPVIEAVHQDRVIGRAEVQPMDGHPGHFLLSADLPADILTEGVTILRLRTTADHQTLDTITIVAGEPMEDDFRAEMRFLREELELLKRAFRRHCVETSTD